MIMIIRRFSAGFVRLLKYFSFGISVFLPGVYVALGTFPSRTDSHQLAVYHCVGRVRTPLSLMNEAIMTLIFMKSCGGGAAVAQGRRPRGVYHRRHRHR